MEMTKTTWWMVGGSSLAVIGVGVYLYFKKKKAKEQNSGYKIGASQANIGSGVKVNTSGTGSIKKEPNWNSPFDMNYIKDVQKWVYPKNIVILDKTTAKRYAKVLKNAKGIFNDDEAAVKNIFKKLQSKTDVASMSKAFYEEHKGKDMWQHLNSFLNHSEMKEYVWKYINRLPNYKLS